jgi:hypothetical protein
MLAKRRRRRYVWPRREVLPRRCLPVGRGSRCWRATRLRTAIDPGRFHRIYKLPVRSRVARQHLLPRPTGKHRRGSTSRRGHTYRRRRRFANIHALAHALDSNCRRSGHPAHCRHIQYRAPATPAPHSAGCARSVFASKESLDGSSRGSGLQATSVVQAC